MARKRKPPRTGRELTLEILDTLLANKGNREKIKDALQQKLDEDPLAFYRTYIQPLEQKRPKPADAPPPVEGADLARQVQEMSGGGAEPKLESEGSTKNEDN